MTRHKEQQLEKQQLESLKGKWPEGYRDKLDMFNSTAKYRSEMRFLSRMLDVQPNENVLDYGCGRGTLVKYLGIRTEGKIYGYDKHYWLDQEEPPFWWRQDFYFQFSKICFMHSLAHLPNPFETINMLKSQFLDDDGRVYVVTPNKHWLDMHNNPNYVPDPTVKEHFTSATLEKLFRSAGYKIEHQGQFGELSNVHNERLFIVAAR